MTDTHKETEHKHEEGDKCNDHDDHEDDKNEIEGVEGDHKQTRGEKKFKKAMMKMGLKAVENITRVTLKTSKNMVMYIDEPFVMKSSDQAYVIFGEAKFFDYNKAMAENQAEKFSNPNMFNETKPKMNEIAEEEEEDTAPEDLENVKEEDVANLISYSNCSRKTAIKTLKATGGDIVEAITRLS